jgi:hypothetical protein
LEEIVREKRTEKGENQRNMGRENAETKENRKRKGREDQTGEVKNKN